MIHLDGVSKVYQTPTTSITALDRVGLRIRQGDFLAIAGPSGSGKSTLLNLLGCLDRPTSGILTITGVDTATLTDQQRSRLRNRSIGFVFQMFNLIPELTVIENVELPLVYAGMRRGRRERAQDALARVGMLRQYDQRAGRLSGGEQQRTAIARALINEPELILADEPTGSIDAESAEQVLGILADLHSHGRTVVLVTHNASVAAVARRSLRLVAGRLEQEAITPLPVPQRRRRAEAYRAHPVADPAV